MMVNRLDRLTTTHRRLLSIIGIALPFLAGYMMLRWYYAQGYYTHTDFRVKWFFALFLLGGVAAFLLRRWWVPICVPAAFFLGWFVEEFLAFFAHLGTWWYLWHGGLYSIFRFGDFVELALPSLLSIIVGALLCLAALRGVPMFQHTKIGRHLLEKDSHAKRRLLLSIGIPLGGGFLIPMLFRWWHINLAPTEWLAFVEVLFLAGVGAYFVARWWAVIVAPLLILGGFLLAFASIGEISSSWMGLWLQKFVPLILVSGLIGGTTGVAVVKFGERLKIEAKLQNSRTRADRLPTPPIPEPAPAPKTRGQQETIPVPPPVPAKEPVEQNEIARVVAQMQREYAEAKSNAPNDGKPKML